MTKKRSNSDQFTTDEAQTAARLVDEGNVRCKIRHGLAYPVLRVTMCDREALEPVARVFRTTIIASKLKDVKCPPHLFPPDGKGVWDVETTGSPAEQIAQYLKPILTKEFIRKWDEQKKKCEAKSRPRIRKKYRPRKILYKKNFYNRL